MRNYFSFFYLQVSKSFRNVIIVMENSLSSCERGWNDEIFKWVVIYCEIIHRTMKMLIMAVHSTLLFHEMPFFWKIYSAFTYFSTSQFALSPQTCTGSGKEVNFSRLLIYGFGKLLSTSNFKFSILLFPLISSSVPHNSQTTFFCLR